MRKLFYVNVFRFVFSGTRLFGTTAALRKLEIQRHARDHFGRKGDPTMASKTLFRSIAGRLLPKTDTLNEEGRAAYAFAADHALAQYAATGCLNSTFYASDAEQLDRVVELCRKVEPEFIARTAVYA